MKATVIAGRRGRTFWTDALRPGRMHDATAARNEGIVVCFQHFPNVEALDDGYLGITPRPVAQAGIQELLTSRVCHAHQDLARTSRDIRMRPHLG